MFLISYCFQPLLIDIIKYNGCGNSSTFIFLIPHYLSMALVGFLPKKQKLKDCKWMKICVISMLDIFNQLLKKVGLIFAGSSLYIIVDSCTLIFTAIWRRLLLKRKINKVELLGILLISSGIAAKSNNLKIEISKDEILGSLLVFISNIIMGLTFVLNEKYMHEEMEGPNIVCIMGICCFSLVFLWTCIWTLPNFDELIIQNIRKKNGNVNIILFSFLLLFIFNFITSSTLWYIMKLNGSLAVGSLKGLKVAIICIFSHIFFCKHDPKQCLNFCSALSVCLCVLGVTIYTYNKFLLSYLNMIDSYYMKTKAKLYTMDYKHHI